MAAAFGCRQPPRNLHLTRGLRRELGRTGTSARPGEDVTRDEPSSGPYTSAAYGSAHRCGQASGGSGPACVPLSLRPPRRYRPRSSAWEDWAARVVPRRRRRVGRAELPSLEPASRGSRSPERCGRFRRARCNSEEARCASRCLPGTFSSIRAKGECVLRLSCGYCCKNKGHLQD
jgi:hypothetical protein